MGVWAAGIFDNDAANDYRDQFEEEFQKTIESLFADDRAFREDVRSGQGLILPAMAMWTAVVKLGFDYVLLERTMVEGWKERYLTAFDAFAEQAGPRPKGYPAFNVATVDKTYLRQRRKVIEKTFDAFLACIADEESSSVDTPAPEAPHE